MVFSFPVPGDFGGNQITVNSEQAAEKLCRVESLTPHVPPFVWLFIRPPWSSKGACCKECVFKNMKQYCVKEVDYFPWH